MQIYHMNGSVFQNIPNFQPQLAQILRIFEKQSGNFGQKMAQNQDNFLIYKWAAFSSNIECMYGSTFDFPAAHPCQNQTCVLPPFQPPLPLK